MDRVTTGLGLRYVYTVVIAPSSFAIILLDAVFTLLPPCLPLTPSNVPFPPASLTISPTRTLKSETLRIRTLPESTCLVPAFREPEKPKHTHHYEHIRTYDRFW